MMFSKYGAEEIAVTIITYEEQTRGWLSYIAKAHTLEEQIIAYRKLEKHIATFSKIAIVGFYNCYGEGGQDAHPTMWLCV